MGIEAFSSAYIMDRDSGEFISRKHQVIAEIIQDYDPNLFLVWIPPHDRLPTDTKPFAVLHRPTDGREQYIVFVLSEDELDERVLARLWGGDLRKSDVLGRLDRLADARKAIEYRTELDRREEMHDKAKSILRSPLHTYRLSKDRKLSL